MVIKLEGWGKPLITWPLVEELFFEASLMNPNTEAVTDPASSPMKIQVRYLYTSKISVGSQKCYVYTLHKDKWNENMKRRK